jgi:hypothetical protein
MAFILGVGQDIGPLHLGLSVHQSTLTDETTFTSPDDTEPSGEHSITFTDKTSRTIIGPTVGLITHGVSLLVTPVLPPLVSTSTESTVDSSSDDGFSGDDAEIDSDSAVSGLILEIGYSFSIGPVAIGPQITYEALRTKLDQTTTTTNEVGDVTVTKDEGTVSQTKMIPMVSVRLAI